MLCRKTLWTPAFAGVAVGARLAIQADIVELVNLLSVRPRLKDCGGGGGSCRGGRVDGLQ